MKQKTALLLITFIFVNLFSFSLPVKAATGSFDDLKFLDVEYSPQLELFLAVANEGSNGKIFASTDGENWVLAHTSSTALGRGESDCIVWWEKEQAFLVYAGSANPMIISHDGFTWTEKFPAPSLPNGGITTDGENLYVYGGSRIREYSSIENDYIEHIITDRPSSYADLAAIRQIGDTKLMIGVMSYRGSISIDGGETWTFKDPFANYGTISDLAYSELQGAIYGAVRVQGWQMVRFNTDGTTTAAFSTGVSGKVSSVTIADGNIFVGSVTGGIYKAPETRDLTSSAELFTEITPDGNGTNEADIKRMAYGNGALVVLANKLTKEGVKSGIAVSKSNFETYKYISNYSTIPYSISAEGENRFEIPGSNQSAASFEPQFKLVAVNGRETSNDTIQTMEAVGQLPDGITFDGQSFLVQPNADIGKARLKVTSSGGSEGEFDVSFVKESSISWEGTFELTTPYTGEPDDKWVYSAKVLDNEGNVMTDRITAITLDSELVDGATFDEQTATLTLKDTSSLGEITLKAISKSEPSVFDTKVIRVARKKATSIGVTGEIAIMVSETKNEILNYTATVQDQTNKPMPMENLVWSVKNKATNGEYKGISINSQTGVLTVTPAALDGIAVITATLEADSSVSGSIELVLSIHENRKFSAAVELLGADIDVNNVSGDINLPTEWLYGSTVKWHSSMPSIVSTDGKVTIDTSQEKTATLTATITRGWETAKKVFNIIIPKKYNILENGDFEGDNYEPWVTKGNAKIALNTSNANNGETGLLIRERKNAQDGAVQTISLKSGATYIFEVYAKGTVGGQVVNIGTLETKSSIASGSISTDKFTKIEGVHTFSQNENPSISNVYVNTKSGTDDFYIDDYRIFEVTIEFTELMTAIQTAEDTRLKADVDKAKELLFSFYATSEKDNWSRRIADITIKSEGGGSPGGGGGGGKPVAINLPIIDTPVIDNSEEVYDHRLIFKDMKGHWAKDDVEFMAIKGFVNGKEEGQFAPEDYISRAEFAALVVRTMELPETEYINSFYDVVSEDWYSKIVQSAKNAGLINGNNGLFLPNDPITREEMTKIIVSAYSLKTDYQIQTGGALYYNDFYDISSWAYDYIVSAVNLSLVNGVSDTMFEPKTYATRAQSVAVLKRLYEKVVSE